MLSAKQLLGRRSEAIALRLLTSQGYAIEATNVRFPVGEIDIIAREGHTLCFVEVRSTSSDHWGGPLATIDARKQRHLIRAAKWYLSRHPSELPEIRFDVVAITWNDGKAPTTELIRGAFDAG
jgi:putative endonuclease